MQFLDDEGTQVLRRSEQSSDVLIVNSCCIWDDLHLTVHHIVKELSVLGKLHDHEDDVRSFDDLVELCNG